MKYKLNKDQTIQLVYITISSLLHNVNHCISNMDILQKNKFIDGIKIEGMTGETTIGEMMEYQREKLEAISEFFKGASLNLHYHKKENLPKDFFKEDTNGKD